MTAYTGTETRCRCPNCGYWHDSDCTGGTFGYAYSTGWSASSFTVPVIDTAEKLRRREREALDRLRKRWGDLAWVRLWWLQKREALAMRRRVQRRPALRLRSCRRPWPAAVTAWRLQVERLRKGSRETRTEPRRRRERRA